MDYALLRAVRSFVLVIALVTQSYNCFFGASIPWHAQSIVLSSDEHHDIDCRVLSRVRYWSLQYLSWRQRHMYAALAAGFLRSITRDL